MAKPSIDDLPEFDRFYHKFGKALALWAEVEYNLSLWFERSTKTPFELSQALFFSGRSFETRASLLAAAIANSKLTQEWREFAGEALDKAIKYNSFRNQIAHGLLHTHEFDDDGHPINLRLKKGDRWTLRDGIGAAQLSVAADNFLRLSTIMTHAYVTHGTGKPPAEFLQQLSELPNAADSKELSQKQKGRQRQLQAALRKQKK